MYYSPQALFRPASFAFASWPHSLPELIFDADPTFIFKYLLEYLSITFGPNQSRFSFSNNDSSGSYFGGGALYMKISVLHIYAQPSLCILFSPLSKKTKMKQWSSYFSVIYVTYVFFLFKGIYPML